MQTTTRLALTLTLGLMLAACSKVNIDNYNKLKAGQSFEEVRALLGKPTSCNDIMTARNCTWGDDKHFINVSFVGNEVVLFGSGNLR